MAGDPRAPFFRQRAERPGTSPLRHLLQLEGCLQRTSRRRAPCGGCQNISRLPQATEYQEYLAGRERAACAPVQMPDQRAPIRVRRSVLQATRVHLAVFMERWHGGHHQRSRFGLTGGTFCKGEEWMRSGLSCGTGSRGLFRARTGWPTSCQAEPQSASTRICSRTRWSGRCALRCLRRTFRCEGWMQI